MRSPGGGRIAVLAMALMSIAASCTMQATPAFARAPEPVRESAVPTAPAVDNLVIARAPTVDSLALVSFELDSGGAVAAHAHQAVFLRGEVVALAVTAVTVPRSGYNVITGDSAFLSERWRSDSSLASSRLAETRNRHRGPASPSITASTSASRAIRLTSRYLS